MKNEFWFVSIFFLRQKNEFWFVSIFFRRQSNLTSKITEAKLGLYYCFHGDPFLHLLFPKAADSRQGRQERNLIVRLNVSSNIMCNFLAMVLMQIKARIAFSGPDSGDLCSMSNVSNKWALLDSLFIIVFAVPKLFISAEK